MVMIDLGHEKKSVGVISVTQVTEASPPGAAEAADVPTYAQVTRIGVEHSSVSPAQDADGRR